MTEFCVTSKIKYFNSCDDMGKISGLHIVDVYIRVRRYQLN